MLNKTKNKTISLLKWAEKYTHTDMLYLAKNSFWAFGGKAIAGITSFLTAILFARLLPAQFFGQYQFILATISLIGILSIPGVNNAILKPLTKGDNKIFKEASLLSFKWSILGSISLITVGIYHIYATNLFFGLSFGVAALLFPFNHGLNKWQIYFISKKKFKKLHILSSIQNFLAFVIIGATLLTGTTNIILITLAGLITVSIINTFLYFIIKKEYSSSKKTSKSWKKYSYFLTKIQIMNTLAYQADKLAIGTFISFNELAIYAMGFKFVQVIQDSLKSFIAVLNPKIAEKNTFNIKKYTLIFFVSFLFSSMLIFITPPIIRIAFGENYYATIPIVQLLLFFLPFWVLNTILNNHIILFLQNKKIIALTKTMTPAIYLILIPITLPLFGTIGIAFLYGFRNVINLTLSLGLIYKHK